MNPGSKRRVGRLAATGIATTCAVGLAIPSVATQALAAPPVTPPDVVAPTLTVNRYLSFEVGRSISPTVDVTTVHDPCSLDAFHHVPVWLKWKGTDAEGPVTFDLFKHDYANPADSSLVFGNTSLAAYDYVFTDQQKVVCTSTPEQLADLHHLFRVVAKDAAGNTASVGPFSHGSLYSIQETGPQRRTAPDNPPVPPRGPLGAVVKVKGFTRIAVAGADAGHRLTSTHDKDTVTYTAITGAGEYIALVAPVGPDRGRFAVFIDGLLASRVDTLSDTPRPDVIVWQKAFSAGHHTITVFNLGTLNRPRVDIDAVLAS